MATKTVLEGVRDALHNEMARDSRVFIMGEDVGPRGNVFLITKGFLEEFGRQRVIDTPLAEASIVGIAVGAAMAGMRPVAEIQFADFIYPAYNQIVGEAAKIRYRSAGGNSCPLVIRTPYGGGVRGALSHSVSVEALFYHVPGLKICVPSTPADAQGMLTAAIRDEDPVLFLEHKRTYRLIKGDVPDGDFTVPIGKADVARAGKDLSVITYGLMRHYAVEAAETLAKEGVEAEVIDLRSIRPMDRSAILQSVAKTRRVLIVHEDQKFGGIGAEVAAIIAEEALFDLDAPIRRVCGPDVPAMGYAKEYEEAFMPNPEKIAAAMRELAHV
jgi:2-oxoisovalerate dehydrogenase E1 component beta subunit